MLSLLLITAALAVQYPQPAPKLAPTRTARVTQATPLSTASVSRTVFHDRMRELWSDHVAYTRNFIISGSAGLPDTAEVAQRLLRNQDEIGEAIKPYFGDAAGSQLASLLRSHIALAAKTLIAEGNGISMHDSSSQYISVSMYSSKTDSVRLRTSSQYPTMPGRQADTTKSRSQDQAQSQTGQVDSTALNQAIAALRANGDSIATLLASTNTRGWSQETMKGAIQMHLNLLLQEATAQLKKDWSGSIAAYDESQHQAMLMADMLSDGIIKQFPSRFTNKATTVSSR